MSRHFCCPSRHNVVSLSRASRKCFLSRHFAEILLPKCQIFLELPVLQSRQLQPSDNQQSYQLQLGDNYNSRQLQLVMTRLSSVKESTANLDDPADGK